MRWRKLIVITAIAEAFTVFLEFGLPATQHRMFSDPFFPNVIVFHQSPPGCIVDFQGNLIIASAKYALFWAFLVFGTATVLFLIRRKRSSATH